MEIETKNDLRLISRAVRERWDVDRERLLKALWQVIDNRDPDLLLGAIAEMRKLDEINVKREAIQQRKLDGDDDRRLQLLELAQRIPAGELARLASDNGITGDPAIVDGRAANAARVDGEEAGG